MLISVIICTKDRADDLQQTLKSLGDVRVPEGCTCELLIVDNNSHDHTAAVIAKAVLPQMTVRPFVEKNIGQGRARNRGLSEAHGEILVFTDDDLRFHTEWLGDLTGPLRRREAELATGIMRLAPHLERDWMKPMHFVWLAAPTLDSSFSGSPELIGANMALSRQVLSRVPRFDPELGPGAYGFGDDTLFGYQAERAGYAIRAVSLSTEHHFLPDRLTRGSFLRHAEKLGRTGAYLAYHWEHRPMLAARANFYRKLLQIAAWRKSHPSDIRNPEGMHPSEMHHLRSLHLYGQTLIEQRRPRSYEQYGLVKKPNVIT